jgi:hypothetical protein
MNSGIYFDCIPKKIQQNIISSAIFLLNTRCLRQLKTLSYDPGFASLRLREKIFSARFPGGYLMSLINLKF